MSTSLARWSRVWLCVADDGHYPQGLGDEIGVFVVDILGAADEKGEAVNRIENDVFEADGGKLLNLALEPG